MSRSDRTWMLEGLDSLSLRERQFSVIEGEIIELGSLLFAGQDSTSTVHLRE